MPLDHRQYEGTPYSTGTAELGNRIFHWVVTEGDEGMRIGTRVLSVSDGRVDPTSGEFYEGRVSQQRSAEPSDQ